MRYLVATDGSNVSDEAVKYAAKHAATFEKTLEIVHVITPETEFVNGDLVMQGQERAAEEGQQTLDRSIEIASEAVPSHDLEIQTLLLTGQPATTIANRAKEADAEAIFIGHRGLSSEREEIVGSVAKQVVSRASVPVTVVR